MPLKIVRNDITKMHADAIVNTANDRPIVNTGCDYAIYQAAGYDELLAYRKKNIGSVPEGEAFITPGYKLDCKYIIHAVSPLFIDGNSGEETKLRSCYKNALALAVKYDVHSIAFPLISTGGFGYPKEEGFRIAVDEINAFLMKHDMLVYIVVFGNTTTNLGKKLYPALESYIDQRYVQEKEVEEYDSFYEEVPRTYGTSRHPESAVRSPLFTDFKNHYRRINRRERIYREQEQNQEPRLEIEAGTACFPDLNSDEFFSELEHGLNEQMLHLTDTFSEYLIYLIDSKGMSYPDVYKAALVDKKVFSKIKNNPDWHPKKITAMCLCIGAKLNLDQTKDLLARAGYALSPCDKRDLIFSFFIEHEIYDIVELDIQLEEFGLPCLIPT